MSTIKNKKLSNFSFSFSYLMVTMNDVDLITEALNCARYNKPDELVQLLDANPRLSLHLLKGANGNTPLHMACANAHLGKKQ
jgi:ankyrin repeat protein